MLGAAEKAEWPQFNYGHNYNIESRETIYAWFGRWLKGMQTGSASGDAV